MKKIAILGAGGFVGRSLTAYFNGKYEVLPVTRRNFSLLDECAVESFINNEKPQVIINCANEGGARKGGYSESTDIVANNLRMFFNIERCMTDNMRMINFGSGAQYNKQRELVKVSEETVGEVIPHDAYGFSKLVMSKFICGNSRRQIFNPIIFGLFGPFEDYTFKFISNACIKNLLGMPIVINQNVRFDYLYIDDFFSIIDRLIEAEADSLTHHEFNITPTESITLTEIVDIINEIGDNKSEITVKNRD